jgi:D-sedoheptulose 7-phosphate isomerase
METGTFIARYATEFHRAVDSVEVTDGSGHQMGFAAAVDFCAGILAQTQREGRHIYIIGNGGSAAIASHAAIDLWKNGGIPAHAFNDPSLLTCISNDIGFDRVFAVPIDMFAAPGDLVIAVSSSGNSVNVVNACHAAKEKGCRLVTLSGFSHENTIRPLGDINFFVPAFSYGFAEIIHQYILHCILDAKMYCLDRKDVFYKNEPMQTV